MSPVVALLLLALTPAQMLERLKAPPITTVEGLVQVYANCPADMRREYQMPVSDFVSDVCRSLYRVRSIQPRRFPEPGLVVYLGDSTTNDTTVGVRVARRDHGGAVTRLYLPAPGHADLEKVRVEAARAFVRAVEGRELGEDEARRLVRSANPKLKVDDEYEEIASWMRGERTDDDERYLKLARSVLEPGVAREADVLRFASRLYLYPASYDQPFCGRLTGCSFRDAVKLAKEDRTVREAALAKTAEMLVLGGGRGERMKAASAAYALFLAELAKGDLADERLCRLLEVADELLKGVVE